MSMSEKASHLERLLTFIRGLGSASDIEQFLQHLTVAASELTDSAAGSVLKFDVTTTALRFVAVPWSQRLPMKNIVVPLDESVAGWVFGNDEPLIVQDVKNDPRHFKAVDQATNFTTTSLMAVPIKVQGNTIGVLEVVNKANNAHYTEDDVTILEMLALYAGMALWNANLEASMQGTRDEIAGLDRMKRNFIAITSHELRTPLGLILGHATFLKEILPGEHYESMDAIIRNATRLKEIIENLAKVDNYEAGVARIRQKSISLSVVVDDVVASFQDMASQKNITLQKAIRGQNFEVDADENKISVAISNLLRNAITFTNEGGEVNVIVESIPEHVQVSVKDNGIGIPANELAHVFERFFQVESHLTRRHTGMGLGLSVAKTMIEMHGGRIWVESIEGKGSTFTFILPVHSQQTDPDGHPLNS